MDISKYTGYFHDGTLIDIKHDGKNIMFFLESAEIEPDEIIDKRILSNTNTLTGILNVINIKNTLIGNKEYKGTLRKEYDDGEILELKIHNNKMRLLIEWKNFPPKTRVRDFGEIEIEAEKIYWENIPNLLENNYNED